MKLNAIVIADDAAKDIGELCVMLKDRTNQLLEQFGQANNDIQIDKIDYCHDVINKNNLSEKVSQVNSNNFLCCLFGHGKDVAFCMNNEDIVTTTENHYIFSNALIYTFSCLNGGSLADVLIENNAKVFVGYISNANCPYGLDDETRDIAMSFVSSFLSGKTVKDAVDDLKTSYEKAIFNDEFEPFQRLWFQENRDGITIKGDGMLTIKDMLVA